MLHSKQLFAFGGIQATVTNLSLNTETDGTSLRGSDAARLMVSRAVYGPFLRGRYRSPFGGGGVTQGLYYIAASFGLSLFAVASIFYRFTGGCVPSWRGRFIC
jgi:hypothetical protein